MANWRDCPPHALAAASAASVRSKIIQASASPSAAIILSVRQIAAGMSQATNSTPATMRFAMKDTEQACVPAIMVCREVGRLLGAVMRGWSGAWGQGLGDLLDAVSGGNKMPRYDAA